MRIFPTFAAKQMASQAAEDLAHGRVIEAVAKMHNAHRMAMEWHERLAAELARSHRKLNGQEPISGEN